MKNFLIILDNIEKTINQNVKSWLEEFDGQFRKNIKRVKHQKDFSFIILEDTNTLSTILDSKKIKKIREENDGITFYIVLHNSALGDDKDIIKKAFQDEFKTPHVIAESHFEHEGFYHDKMPLLTQDTGVTFSEIIDGYFSTDIETKEFDLLNNKLTFLHKLLGNKVTQEDVDKELAILGYKDSVKYNKNNESIKNIRDLILEAF